MVKNQIPTTTTSLGAGGEKDNSNSESSSSGKTNCIPTVQISYFLVNPEKNSTCNIENNGICTNKTMTCEIKIQNMDETTNGNFDIELIFLEEKKAREDAFDIKNSRFFIEAGKEQVKSD